MQHLTEKWLSLGEHLLKEIVASTAFEWMVGVFDT